MLRRSHEADNFCPFSLRYHYCHNRATQTLWMTCRNETMDQRQAPSYVCWAVNHHVWPLNMLVSDVMPLLKFHVWRGAWRHREIASALVNVWYYGQCSIYSAKILCSRVNINWDSSVSSQSWPMPTCVHWLFVCHLSACVCSCFNVTLDWFSNSNQPTLVDRH